MLRRNPAIQSEFLKVEILISFKIYSRVIPHMRRQHLSEELSCQQPVSEVNLSGGEPSDGSKEQRNDDSNVGFDIKRQGRQINAVSESHFSGYVF